MKGLVYVAKDGRTGKKFVGSMLPGTGGKWKDSFLNSIGSCGLKNFTWAIIEENIPEEELGAKEMFYASEMGVKV